MKVKFLQKKKTKIIAADIQKVKKMLDSGQYTNAKYVREFENDLVNILMPNTVLL